MGTIADAFRFMYYVCNDIDPVTLDPKNYAYYYSSIGNNNVRWGHQEYYSPLYGGNYYMYDCSSLIGAALIYAGILDSSIEDYFWTGNMADVLQNVGFKLFDPDLNTLQPGDILLNHNSQSQHTEMLSNYDETSRTWYAMGAHNSHLRPVSEQISSRATNIPIWQYALRLDPQESAFIEWTNFKFYGKYTGTFDRASQEAYINACMISSVLMSNTTYGTNTDFIRNNNVWTKQAVCALLGNIEVESGYNPAILENNEILPRRTSTVNDYWDTLYSSSDYAGITSVMQTQNIPIGGYGFVQFTPNYKYLGLNDQLKLSNSDAWDDIENQSGFDRFYAGGHGFYDTNNVNWTARYPFFSPPYAGDYNSTDSPFDIPGQPGSHYRIFDTSFDDAITQLLFLSNECCPKEWDSNVVLDNGNTMTFDEFRTNLTEHSYDRVTDYDSLDPLTEAFMKCFEKPASYSTLYQRKLAARYWWDRLNNMVAVTPPGTQFRENKKALWKKVLFPSVTINFK